MPKVWCENDEGINTVRLSTGIENTQTLLDDSGQALEGIYYKVLLGNYINKTTSAFYKEATFYSTREVIHYLENTGFTDFKINQTIFKSLDSIDKIEPVKQGYGKGSFIVIKAGKRN